MRRRATQTTDPHARRWRPGYGALLLLVLIIAAILRFAGLDWDNGRYLHPDERFMVMVTVDTAWPDTVGDYFDSENSPLNPYNTRHGTFVYGTFPLFLTKALSGLLGTDVYGQAHLVGRALSALADTGTVFLVAWIARRFFGNRAGLLAGFMIAFTMLHIQSAHFYTVDAMSVFFATATFVAVLKGWDSKSLALFAVAGLMAGLAGASKPNYLIALGFFALPVLETIRLHGIDGLFPIARRKVLPIIPAVLVAGLVAFWTFRIGQPYAFAGPHLWNVGLNRQWVDDLSYWSTAQSGLIDIKSSVQWVGRTPVAYIVQNMVAWGMGPPLGIASLAALALGTWRVLRSQRWPSWWFLGMLGWSLAQLFLYGTNIAQAQRYLLPIYPFLIAMAAGLLVEAAGRIGRIAPRPGSDPRSMSRAQGPRLQIPVNIGSALIAVTMVYTAVYGVAFDTLFVRPLSRVQASEWIYENIPAGSTLTHEYWDDALPIALEGEDAFAYRHTTLDLYGYEGPDSTKLSRIIGQLNSADYIILSSNRIIGSVPRQPERYPMATHYYEMLENGGLGFELVAEFSQVPELFGIRFDDTNAEETITVYEHPYVRIFRKTDAFDVERVYAELDAAMGYGGVNYLPGDPVGDQMFLTDAEWANYDANGTWSAIYDPGSVFNRSPALWWYIGMQVLTVPALPLAWVLFRRFPDGGFAIAKVLGLLFVTWMAWLIASTGVFPFGQWTIVGAWVLVATIPALTIRRQFGTFVAEMIARWRWIVATEVLFLAAYAGMAWLRSRNAGFWTPGGTDDTPFYLAMFNAAARSTSFPPFDAWLSGGQVHTPYWGMMPWVLMTRLTGVVPNTGYTLAFAGIFALTVVAVWSVASAMIRRIVRRPVTARWLGLLAPVLIGAAGTLSVVAKAGQGAWGFTARPADWPIGGVAGDVLYGIGNVLTQGPELPATFLNDVTEQDAAFPFLTPFTAMIAGDLSPAATILPIFTLAIAIAAAIVSRDVRPRAYTGLLVAGGGTAGVMSASATWGLPVTVAILAAAIVIRLVHARCWSHPWPIARDIALHILATVVVGVMSFLPFHLEFHPTERNTVTAPGLSLQQLVLIGGAFLLLAGVYLLAGTVRVLEESREEGIAGRVAAGLTVLVAIGGTIASVWLDSAALLLLIGLLLVVIALWYRQREPMHLLLLAFIGVGAGILLYTPLAPMPSTPFGHSTAREMSTVVWIVLGMAATALIAWLADALGRLPARIGTSASTVAIGTATILLTGMLAGPVMAASVVTGSALERSLDATAFLRTIEDPQASAADRDAAIWLMENVEGLPVLLEAPGWDHQYGGRISAMTGLPAVIGWPTPERLTRPGWDQVVTQRQDAANRIYSSLGTFDSIEPLLQQYGVSLIYVGQLERATYDEMALRKFEVAADEGLLEVVYAQDGVMIYRYTSSR